MDSISQILFEHGSFSKISHIISDTFAKNGLLGHLLPIRCPDSMGYESIIAGGISCCLDRGVVGSFDLETSSSQSPILSLASEKKGGDIILVFDNIRCGKVVQAAIQIIQQKYGFNIIGIATINSPSTSKLCMIEFSSYYGNAPIISMFRGGKLEQQQLQGQQQVNSFSMCDCHDVNKGGDVLQKQQFEEHHVENGEYNNKSNVDDNAMDTDDSTAIAADDGTSDSKTIEGVDEVVVVLSEENSTISVVDFKEQDDNEIAASDVAKESIFLQSDSVPIERYEMEEVSSLSLIQNASDKQQQSLSSSVAESGASASGSGNNNKKDLKNVTQLMSSSGDNNRLTIRHFASATVLHQTSHEFHSQTSASTSSHSTTNNLLMEQVENGPRYWIARVSANSPCEDAFVVSHCNEINAWFYSVVDGHGGPLVGVLVRDRIANVMFDHLSKALSSWDASCKSQQEQGKSVDPSTLEKKFEAMIQSTLTQAVLALDDIITEIIKEKSIEALKNAYASGAMDGNDNDNNSSFAAKRPHLKPMHTSGIGSPVTPAARKKKTLKGIWNSGCCCCFALYLRDRVWVGNLGDCRALLIRRVPDNTSSTTASAKPKDQGFQSNMKFTKPMSDNVMQRIRDQSKQTPKKRSDQDMSGNQNESLDSDSNKIQVTVLSRDHTCDDPREADDVRRRSGDASAIRWNGGQADPLRVDGTLVPTRAFGNTFLKGYAKEGPDDNYGWPRRSVYITAEPEFIQPAIRLDPSEAPVLVLASDGLWAWTTNDEVGAMIHNGCNAIDLVEVSLELAGKHSGMSVKDLEAREQGKERRMVHDDITVIVIDIFSSS